MLLQTGNTIFAALSVSDLPVQSPKYAWIKSVCSIAAYLLGTLFCIHFHRYFGQRRRWTLFCSYMLQTLFVAMSAAIVLHEKASESPAKPHLPPTAKRLPKDPGFPWLDLLPIGLLSFQAAGKVVSSRLLQHPLLPTNVLSILYTDLFSDPKLLAWTENTKRNQRLGGLVFYVAGALAGGGLAKSSVGFSGALWLAAGVNFVMACLWLWWPEEPEVFDDDE